MRRRGGRRHAARGVSYAARQVAVKTKYELWVTSAEKRALGEMLERCPGQRLPTAEDVAVPPLGGGQ